MKKFSKEQIDEICELYNSGISIIQVSKQLCCSDITVTKYLKSRGIKIRSMPDMLMLQSKGYLTNSTIFDSIDSELTAYWLGFLVGDGWVYRPKGITGLALKEEDRYHVEAFASIFDKINTVFKMENDHGIAYRVDIANVYLCESLMRKGIIPRKTYNDSDSLQFVPDDLKHHFVRGLFDSDGCVALNDPIRVTFTGRKCTLKQIRELLYTTLNINYNDIRGIDDHGSAFEFNGYNQCETFAKYIYSDATIYLSRKLDIFRNFYF